MTLVAAAAALTVAAWRVDLFGLADAGETEDARPVPVKDLAKDVKGETLSILAASADPSGSPDRIRETVAKCLATIDERAAAAQSADETDQISKIRFRFLTNVLANKCLIDPALLKQARQTYDALMGKTADSDVRRARDVMTPMWDALGVQTTPAESREFLRDEAKLRTGLVRDVARFLLARALVVADPRDREEASGLLRDLAKSPDQPIREESAGWKYEVDALSAGRVLPSFDAKTLKGLPWSLPNEPPACVIRIISVKCGACQTSPDLLRDLRAKWPAAKVRVVLAILADGDPTRVTQDLVAAGAESWPFDVVVDSADISKGHPNDGSSIAYRLHAVGTPKTFVVGRAGLIEDVLFGYVSDPQISKDVDRLLSAPK